MPLSSIGASIGGAITGIFGFLTSGTLAAKVVVAGLAIAARYAIQSIFGNNQQEQQQAPAQASQLETRYGEDLSRQAIFGSVGTAGHHVYRNAYGKGNTIIQDVYRLCDFRIGSVNRVRFDGAWRSLGGSEDSEKGFRLQGTNAEIWIKVYTGTMTQTADSGLISRSNPSGRWTANHVGAGVAYVIVTSVLDKEHLRTPDWSPFFEVYGPALYDWRKDTTAGGSGSDRWATQSTWSGRYENPILQAYALERGLFNGTEMMVGKGVSASDLPLAEWTIAANICDELIEANYRYSSGCIVSSGKGSTHQGNMEPILEACAGSWIELVGEEYPIVGANQASVATITDDDLVTGESFRLSLKRTRSELVNTVAGSFISPDTFYQSAPLATREDDDALAADGERLAVPIPFRAVTKAAVADRLADIALRASRYQANGESVVRPKFLGLKPGQWVTYQSTRFGFTKAFQVLTKQLGSFGTNNARNVFLSLQEVNAGIFDPTAYETTPPDATGQGSPDFESTLQNFAVSGYTVVDEEARQFPAIRATWDAPTDPTVIGTDIEYRPKFQTAATIAHPTVPDDVTVTIMANGIVSSQVYEIRYRLVASPYRATPWSDWAEVTTPNAPQTDVLVSLNEVKDDIRNLMTRLVAVQNSFDAQIERVSAAAAEGLGASTQEISAAVRQGQNLAVSILSLTADISENADGIIANATALIGVQAVANQATASGLIKWEATAAPAGADARFSIFGKASAGGAYKEAGAFLDIFPSSSRWVFLADQFVVSDGTAENLPMVYEGGVLKLAIADIGTVTAGTIRSADSKFIIDLSAGSIQWFD